ncbi:hypothetical protein Agub_g4123 [Astrephomene gubernaculifera]|uniref:Calcineurin-like phosphoesterase domain-containing protein n=1 Tax=Astrephomene gubernaculifera TaxID=47775 RepID=A0AAD3DL10_9CHLO|nr:hypothetical protein Agub_g4123 [Astrephomene gubernaculifera]
MGTQALCTEYDLEEEDPFFTSDVEKVGRSRNTYEHQLRKRRLVLGVAIGVGSVALVALIIGLAWAMGHRKLDYICPSAYDTTRPNLVFFVVGDWGRSGNANQRRVARLMGDVAECLPPEFIISTGDNFYPSGLSSPQDPLFDASFSQVYTGPRMQVPWYAVMGNHDYGDNVDASLLNSGRCLAAPPSAEACTSRCCISPWWQTVPDLAARDLRWNATMGGVLTRRFKLGVAGTLDILFMDTNPFIQSYQNRSWSSFLRGVSSQDSQAIQAQLQTQLNASVASGSSWRLVVGHHPVRSYGKHCMEDDKNNCDDMQFMRPWLRSYRVAAYINGHEHDQQLLKYPEDQVYYVVSGAGSDTREGEFDSLLPEKRANALFLSDAQGFLAVVFAGGTMRLHFYTIRQRGPAYTATVNRPA